MLQAGLTAPQVYEALWQTLTGGKVWQGELHNRKKNGELYIEAAVIAPVLDDSAQVTHYVALKQDVTQRSLDQQALQASLQEKVALLHEVHHRVKNNLQVMTSLLRLEAARSAEPATQRVLQEMKGRIFAMALLHETLYRSSHFSSVDLAVYLRQLASQVLRAQSARGTAVRLVLDLTALNVGMDQATTWGLLVNELLSNALKHGFPDGRAGVVTLQLQPGMATGQWCLSVHDDGVGLPADFEQRRTRSLGLQLVSDLVRQLGGTLDIGPGPGALFAVTFSPQVPFVN
ncbi:blue-light-activated histidine kinase 2 [mine drainage metagenome]|uniref:histidine kinase n=1 Tax=mine drainage metagenome TaxID=410659 RepID=A0A1J5PVY5_9ZZZZ